MVAEPKNVYGSTVLQCAICRRAFFLTSYCSIQLALPFPSYSILGNLYIAAFNLPCRRRGVIHLFWLADQQRVLPSSSRKRAKTRPPNYQYMALCVTQLKEAKL